MFWLTSKSNKCICYCVDVHVYIKPFTTCETDEQRITNSSLSLSTSMGEDSLFSDFSEDLISMVLNSLFCVVRASIMSYIKHILYCISSNYHHQSSFILNIEITPNNYTVYHTIIIIDQVLWLKTQWFSKLFQNQLHFISLISGKKLVWKYWHQAKSTDNRWLEKYTLKTYFVNSYW